VGLPILDREIHTYKRVDLGTDTFETYVLTTREHERGRQKRERVYANQDPHV